MIAPCSSVADMVTPYVGLILLSVLCAGLTCLAGLLYWCLTAPDYYLEPDWFHKEASEATEGDYHDK